MSRFVRRELFAFILIFKKKVSVKVRLVLMTELLGAPLNFTELEVAQSPDPSLEGLAWRGRDFDVAHSVEVRYCATGLWDRKRLIIEKILATRVFREEAALALDMEEYLNLNRTGNQNDHFPTLLKSLKEAVQGFTDASEARQGVHM